MPGEKRTLRSNKSDASLSANGKKTKSDSQGSISNKDRPTPTRSTSSRNKSISGKKGVTSFAKEMSGDKPQMNGSDPVENGINGKEDTEMEEGAPKAPGSTKSRKDKDGDEEMTVVVPPSKDSKVAGTFEEDKDGDININGVDDAPKKTTAEPVVDLKAKAMAGMFDLLLLLSDNAAAPDCQSTNTVFARQTSKPISSS